MELKTPLDMICRIIARARDWDVQLPSNESDDVHESGSASTDDDKYDTLTDEKSDTVEAAIEAALDDLAEDQRAEVLALAWIGNGTFDISDWDDAMSEATDPDGDPVLEQLMDMPMLAAYLDAGLEAFDLSCDGIGLLD